MRDVFNEIFNDFIMAISCCILNGLFNRFLAHKKFAFFLINGVFNVNYPTLIGRFLWHFLAQKWNCEKTTVDDRKTAVKRGLSETLLDFIAADQLGEVVDNPREKVLVVVDRGVKKGRRDNVLVNQRRNTESIAWLRCVLIELRNETLNESDVLAVAAPHGIQNPLFQNHPIQFKTLSNQNLTILIIIIQIIVVV